MNYEEARDLIFKVFNNVWNPAYPVRWPDQPGDIPGTETPWARVTLRHTNGQQASLSGEVGTKLYTNSGTLFIQVFTPIGGDMVDGYTLAQQVTNAYRDAKLDVWFRNTRMKEIGASGAFQQINVLTDFQYDDVR